MKRKIWIIILLTGCFLFVFLYGFFKSIKQEGIQESVKGISDIKPDVVIKVADNKKDEISPQQSAGFSEKVRDKGFDDARQNTDKEINILIHELKNGDFQDTEIMDKLIELKGNAVSPLIEILPEASVGLKGQIIFILGRIGDNSATYPLIEALKDENAYIRRNTADALGKIKDKNALDALVISLSDTDGGVRERSAWALGELNNPSAVDYLLNQLFSENEERVKSSIINALGKIRNQQATMPLIRELEAKNDQLYKNEIVVALGEIGDSMALPVLNEYINRLKQYSTTEPMIDFQIDLAIKIAEDAIWKIQGKTP